MNNLNTFLTNTELLLITNVVPLLLGTFAETCSLNLPQKGRKGRPRLLMGCGLIKVA